MTDPDDVLFLFQMTEGTKLARGYINIDEVLAQLKVGRAGAVQVCRQAKINSPEYKAARGAIDQIDVLAEALTGDSRYFHLKAAEASQQPK
ncbi:MAG: hypothetical protein JXQ85_05095 [Cognatishimia sp.]